MRSSATSEGLRLMGVVVRLPGHWKSRKTGDAVMAPSAIVLAGVGAAAAILGGLPALAVVGVGGLAYLARVATLLPKRRQGERIDTMTIADPWRAYVNEALDAQRRYRKAV